MNYQTTKQAELSYESGPVREVSWFNVERIEKWRPFIRNKVVFNPLPDTDGNILAGFSAIQAADISKIADPDLRYALRFADAANAIGSVRDTPWSSHAHFMHVHATKDGFDSEFGHAVYSGVVDGSKDTFLENLHTAKPE